MNYRDNTREELLKELQESQQENMESSAALKKHHKDLWLNRVASGFAYTTSFLGLIVLAGWAFGLNDMSSMGKMFIPMAEETALLFLITGIALALLRRNEKSRILHYFLIGSAVFIGFVALLALIDFATAYKWNLSDFIDSHNALKGVILTGKMSALTAICFLFVCVALLLLPTKAKKYSVIFSSLILFTGYVIVVGYTYGVPVLYGGTIIPMALPTAIAFIIASAGLLFAAGKETAPIRYFIENSTRARMLRNILPVIFLSMLAHDFIYAFTNEDYSSSTALTNSVIDIVVLLVTGAIISLMSRSIGNSIDRNIADRIKAEEELIIAKEHAEESDRLKSAFLANMSHEIRTPMNGILGFAELLKEPDLTGDEQQEYIKIIEKSGARMLNIINDIVDISKIEAGLMKLDMKEFNINEQVEYIYTFFKPEVEAKRMTFSLKNTLTAKEATITTDREKLYAILTNLVKNAIKYTDQGSVEFGYKLVGTHGRASQLQFYIKDTGIGIPKDRQEAIFERFIQADILDKKARQGAGLGLSISRAYIQLLGGKIWVESEEGVGSTFYFTLPYNAEPVKKNVVQRLAPSDKTDSIRKLKILIAEDDETSEMLIAITMKTISYEVLKATTGIEAVEACRSNPDIDLVLMDIQMPEMNGYETTRQIRQFNKNVIIVAQTAYALSGDPEKALEAGCNDYISKPIKKDELLALIQQHFYK
jgi:signal transduction histidine kinase